MSGLDLTGIRLTAPGATAPLFPDLSLTVGPGVITALMGPSGVGKSSLIAFVAGHLPAGFRATGQVRLNGRDITAEVPEARGIGLLFQDAVLFPHLSVGDNLAFGLSRRTHGRAARRARVEEALAQAGLAGFYARDPATLSGGQAARAALMRALLADPAALLLDEPFARLDRTLRDEMRRFTFDLIRARAIPALIVTHDPADAETAGGAVVAL